jgi:hypothetical protein
VTTRRGGQWNGKAISNRIENDLYIGKVREGRDGKHQPIIDAETFRLAQARIAATRTLNGNGRGKRAAAHLLDHGMLKCGCGATMKPAVYPSGTHVYKCRSASDGKGSCGQLPLPQAAIDEAILRYLSENVISAGMTAAELEADQRRAEADAKQARSAAQRNRKQAEARLESGEEKWLDGKLTDLRWSQLKTKLAVERAAAEGEATAADATLAALAEPDPAALVAVERLRRDIARVAEDGSAKLYSELVKRLYERVEVVAGAELDGEPLSEADDAITFEHGGRLYGLVPILRAELADLYGADPLVGMAGVPIASHGRPK